MSSDRDPNAIRLPDDVAQRLLARATELDERHGRTSIDQLRRAATEAGISPAAFEAALAELARGELGRPGPTTSPATGIDVRGRWITSPLRRALVLAGAAIASILLGIGIARSVTEAEESPAMPEAVQVEVAPAASAETDQTVPAPAPARDAEVRAERPAEVRVAPPPVR